MAHLKRERFDEYTRPQVTNKLRDMGGDRGHMVCKGIGVSVFWVPNTFAPPVQLNIPAPKREPI